MRRFAPLLFIACAAPSGDPDVGWDVLRYGDYVGSGVPMDVWFDLVPPVASNLLDREGDAAGIPSAFNLFTHRNGVEVVGGVTCMGCHGGWLLGSYVVGLGNHASDYTDLDTTMFDVAAVAVENRYGDDGPEWEAMWPLVRGARAITPHIEAPFMGVNTAFSMERAAAAYRDPDTLAWRGEPAFEIPEVPLASDVPAWWHVKKKSRLYYTGAGTGNLPRLIAQIGLVAIEDADHYAEIEGQMADLLAWIETIEPPPFPFDVDEALAAEGERLFSAECAACHGTYGEDWTYPERVVALNSVRTDPTYAQGFLEGGFTPWLQESWLARARPRAGFEPQAGYVAPPLDGIWATAPYLHNGSVPDLRALLDSSQRPVAWRRTFDSEDYDPARVGWVWTPAEPGSGDPQVYDTTVVGFGNGGHTYADDLDAAERDALVEYLKTL